MTDNAILQDSLKIPVSKSFDITKENWIYVRYKEDTIYKQISLRTLFLDANQIVDVIGVNGNFRTEISIKLFILIFFKAAYNPTEAFLEECFENKKIDISYFDDYVERMNQKGISFDLLDPVHPFWQATSTMESKMPSKSVACIDSKAASGQNITNIYNRRKSMPIDIFPYYLINQYFCVNSRGEQEAGSPLLTKQPLIIFNHGDTLLEFLFANVDTSDDKTVPSWEYENISKAMFNREYKMNGYMGIMTLPLREIAIDRRTFSETDEVFHVFYKGFSSKGVNGTKIKAEYIQRCTSKNEDIYANRYCPYIITTPKGDRIKGEKGESALFKERELAKNYKNISIFQKLEDRLFLDIHSYELYYLYTDDPNRGLDIISKTLVPFCSNKENGEALEALIEINKQHRRSLENTINELNIALTHKDASQKLIFEAHQHYNNAFIQIYKNVLNSEEVQDIAFLSNQCKKILKDIYLTISNYLCSDRDRLVQYQYMKKLNDKIKHLALKTSTTPCLKAGACTKNSVSH